MDKKSVPWETREYGEDPCARGWMRSNGVTMQRLELAHKIRKNTRTKKYPRGETTEAWKMSEISNSSELPQVT